MRTGALGPALSRFAYSDKAAVEKKLRRFARHGRAAWHVVLDFDRTLTCATEPGQDFYTWNVLGSFIPKDLQEPWGDLYNSYRPLELRGKLTDALAVEWWDQSFDLLQRGKINLCDVEREFISRANIRPGVSKLFDVCKKIEVPVVILSAGIADIIRLWCEHYKVFPDLIVANQLLLSDAGLVEGWDREGMVHVRNKRERGRKELSHLRSERPYAFLAGDSPDDAHMAEGSKAIRTRVYDPRSDEQDDQATQRAALKLFDLILTGGTLEPLVEIIEIML